jgi:hypothetical protein
MSAAWVRFAATGDPNGGGLPAWSRYQKDSDRHLEFGDAGRIGAGLFSDELDFWGDVWAGLRKRWKVPHFPGLTNFAISSCLANQTPGRERMWRINRSSIIIRER